MTDGQILIAEDEKHTRLALNLVLRQAGFDVLLADNGQDALEKIMAPADEDTTIRLIITDFKMPHLDGIGLIDKLREKDIHIPVIVITGYGDGNLARQLEERGCAGYLDKPFIPDEVLGSIQEVLALRAA